MEKAVSLPQEEVPPISVHRLYGHRRTEGTDPILRGGVCDPYMPYNAVCLKTFGGAVSTYIFAAGGVGRHGNQPDGDPPNSLWNRGSPSRFPSAMGRRNAIRGCRSKHHSGSLVDVCTDGPGEKAKKWYHSITMPGCGFRDWVWLPAINPIGIGGWAAGRAGDRVGLEGLRVERGVGVGVGAGRGETPHRGSFS